MDSAQQWALSACVESAGKCTVRVFGHSMWPFVRDGDCIEVLRQMRRPVPGQIVAVFEEGQLIVHRIHHVHRAGRRRWILTTKGDSSPGSSHTFFSDQIAGRVLPGDTINPVRKLFFYPPFNLLALFAGAVMRSLVCDRVHNPAVKL